MICFLRHFKDIAYFLVMLILFQSCTVYKKQTSSVSQASESDDRLIKIRTIDGTKYELKWIEEEDGNIVSIKYTEREYIDKDEIVRIEYDPDPHVISFESLLNQNGAVQIVTKDKKGNHTSSDFIKIVDEGDYIKGYKMTGNDTLTIVIPIDQIEKIQLEDIKKSKAQTRGLAVGLCLGIVIIIAVYDAWKNLDVIQ